MNRAPGNSLEPWSSELASDHPVALAFAQEMEQRSTDERVPGEPESAVHPLGLQTHCLHSSGPVSALVKWGRESRQGVYQKDSKEVKSMAPPPTRPVTLGSYTTA